MNFGKAILPEHEDLAAEAVRFAGEQWNHAFDFTKAGLWERPARLATYAQHGRSHLQGNRCTGIALYPSYQGNKEADTVVLP